MSAINIKLSLDEELVRDASDEDAITIGYLAIDAAKQLLAGGRDAE